MTDISKVGFGNVKDLLNETFHSLLMIILNDDEDLPVRIDACLLFLSRPSYYVFTKYQIEVMTRVITNFKKQLINNYHKRLTKQLTLF